MNRNIVTAFLSTVGSRLVGLIVTAAVTPLLIHFLGVTIYGRYATIMSVFALLTIFMSSGTNTGVKKYIAEERSMNCWKDHVFGYYFRLATLLAVLAAIGFAVAAYTGVVAMVWGAEFEPYFYLLGAMALAVQYREYIRRTLMGLKLEHVSEPLNVLYRIVFGVVGVSLAALEFGVPGLIVAQIVASLVAVGVGLAVVRGRLSFDAIVTTTPDRFPSSDLFNFNHLTIAYVFLLTSLYHIDVLMLEAFKTSELVGYYKAALVIVQFLWILPRSVQGVMVQSTSDLWEQNKVERITDLASRTTRYVLLLTLLLAIGMAALASTFVPLYLGSEMRPAVTPLLLLLPGTVAFAVARPLLAISHAKGDVKALIAATWASATLNFALNLNLIPAYGMVGAAVATTIGYGSLPLFNMLIARDLGYDPLEDVRIVRIVVTGAVAAVPIYFLPAAIENDLLALVVVPVVGFVVYALAAVLTGAVDVGEVLDFCSSLPGPLGEKASELADAADGGSPIKDQSPEVSDRVQQILALTGIVLVVSAVALLTGGAGL
ncbi:lipopolysaccharide biosynthesis protein [Haloarchaeobius amylolyticus]|uniref:lipopolysaccharide biosynthesis protein n=1 Tax=Haloarchaeobius amylolyticus TaxID=1198296 RepID=UPI00226EC98B|nr:polysaccharide biosynthesis C-terminal domain-containing protein [Haloarchaeobius amylolyticus]